MRRERTLEPGTHRGERGSLPLERGVADEHDQLGAPVEVSPDAGSTASAADLEHAPVAPVHDVRRHAAAHESPRIAAFIASRASSGCSR